MGTQGQVEVDFGAGSVQTSVFVSGQDGITADCLVEAWMAVDVNYIGNTHTDHIDDDIIIRAGDIIPGSGFTIYATSLIGNRTGKYLISWVWNSTGTLTAGCCKPFREIYKYQILLSR